MGDIIPIKPKPVTFIPNLLTRNEDILSELYIGLNIAGAEAGYRDDRIAWLKRLEPILVGVVHTDYMEFTEGTWT